MYIYDRKFWIAQSRLLGGGESRGPYVWTNESLGQLTNDLLAPHLLGEFRLDRLPPNVQQRFSKSGAFWRDAVLDAIGAGIKNPNVLADIIFFMQYPTRMTAGVGRLIDKKESDFVKLRAEWILYRAIVIGLLKPAAAAIPACSVFLPAKPSRNYEDYVAAPTTGRITLLINGRNLSVSGPNRDQTKAFDSMQITVESLKSNDSVFLANWQFSPTLVPLTVTNFAGLKSWGDLLKRKAEEGVKIRIIISDLPPAGAPFQTNLSPIDAIIGSLDVSKRDNLKYIFSRHPANLVAAHHQKFMIVKKGKTVIAYCGGLDISFNRTPAGWGPNFVWHDIHAKLEGLIARDLEREFVLRWNREKDKSTGSKITGWKGFETLAQAPITSDDRDVSKNIHKLQMLRTVSVGTNPQDIRRDDIWQGYFRLIGCATRFIYMENQYFHEPKMADAIVKQAQAQSNLIVIIVVTSKSDDPVNIYTQHCLALRHEFFARLFAGIPSNRIRVYTKFTAMIHSKLILVDDKALLMGSANANPRGFFLDTELNVMLEDADAVTRFRRRLWSHDLGVKEETVATWSVSDFIAKWDAVAKANEGKAPDKMTGEGLIPFGPRNASGATSRFIMDVLC
jgi:phosphatidylserine/phosphatidylglycerophosphate/cardiolipin synthase-like enzyme